MELMLIYYIEQPDLCGCTMKELKSEIMNTSVKTIVTAMVLGAFFQLRQS